MQDVPRVKHRTGRLQVWDDLRWIAN